MQRLERGAELRGAVFGAPAQGHRRSLEPARPFRFLREFVFLAERDDLVAERQRLGRLAAVEMHALRDEQGEDERDRLPLRAAERDRFAAARDRAVGIAQRPQRPRRHRARDHAGIDPECSRIGLVLRRLVELARALQQPVRLRKVAREFRGHARHVVDRHQVRRLPRQLGLPHQRGGLFVHERDVAADHVEERQVPEDGEQLRRIAELLAERPRARERRFELGRRPSLHRAQRESPDHLEPELQLQALGASGSAARREPRSASDSASRNPNSAVARPAAR